MVPSFLTTAVLPLLWLSSSIRSEASHLPRYSSSSPSLLNKRALAVAKPLPNGYTYVGCYTEATNGRALTGANYADGTKMTEETCITFCNGKGLKYAGVEYSSECYCGNSLSAGSAAAANAGDCNMACSGNANEPCGGPNRFNLFDSGKTPTTPAGPVTNPGPAGWQSLGCYIDNNKGRALTNGVGTTGGGGALTIALCTAACKSGNYIYAGAEYAGECYCGNAFAGGNGPATNQGDCNMACNGNATEFCGGPNRLNVYQVNGASAPSSASTAATPTSTAAGSATGLPAGWTYKGCYVDNVSGRILSNQQAGGQTMTVESCVASCKAAGYVVAGMEYASECYCGNGLTNGGKLADADTQCNTNCAGNAAEKCGDANRMSIYSNAALGTQVAPGAQTTNLPGSWKYQGCITEGANQQRVWKYQIILENNNTATACLKSCQTFGFGAGGLEYGTECYCGDAANIDTQGAKVAPEGECNVPCSGASQYFCGGGSRLSWYAWTGTPLNVWKRPTGNQAGSYQQLIGGVCIPLLTAPMVNGKYMYVEKYGTGEPNSTGTYELDLSLINNPAQAWRALHVKTDVFCSAGLTLPDRVGRQINIGGWSGPSTFGVRLYIPSGSVGIAGTTDWQENVDELSLQIGRWYPSAMIMVNGSILVVGGEIGSNSAPVPSLEILPKPPGGGVITLDFLQRTDPFNLYPFICVLPSGGIFIAYYNEARVLDEGTFATTKTLPNIPGAVNNFLGGRTYPLEGAAVLLPQYAPYSAPLTVMICGGSTPGAGIAIDNCVSTQPESAGASWLIERMPTQRVMTCMTALPDGTYLITNGARQGVAGFGLGVDPNLNAVLYDPAQPENQRMSIMANTSVARLYHSESILMTDGRVMISGSDPQDGTHPEEYRVEVFSPPYALSGLPKPQFQIQNTNWNYGQQITISVTAANGGPIKVSLMGAETSTHGNSMGQRTIFPAVSCAGNSCVITAPPNGHVCPPGWFQLFVLDNGIPSNSKWVRIGGDPGQLGNWPNSPSFTRPGL